MFSDLPLMWDWKALVRIGHPFGRTQTKRLESTKIWRAVHVKGQKRRVMQEIPNPDPFPKRVKLGDGRGCRVVWPVGDVVAWYKRRGLKVNLQGAAP